MSNQIRVKFRRSAALAVAGAITVIGGIPILAESVWFLPLLLIPLAIAVWAWRAGTDVDERGFTVRALFGSRRVLWEAVDGLVTDGNRVYARLANAHLVPLDAVRPADLPRLISASGQDLESDRPTEAAPIPDEEPANPPTNPTDTVKDSDDTAERVAPEPSTEDSTALNPAAADSTPQAHTTATTAQPIK
ncbi:PH domain-containing protein [Dactylosporangium matsuzakiense]|uniref:Low molecular weight protein antigen 6 PH domain-containing protein n=1 Tax=Dactylosporangium matsuzakiense TaxID=53360 RepID=A0A9W6NRB1_9ACTN|nr:PH domain-containing protein [Dactylosporangium matsuzakiense]GLL06238.1 hypothetical protein GCM10017581_079860 [Dactylosporangium matsuzakiense]